MRTERQTGITKPVVAFRNFAKAPNKMRTTFKSVDVKRKITVGHRCDCYIQTNLKENRP
jgi:hypothetical protein